MTATIDRPAPRGAALVIIDMINDFDCEDADAIREPALNAAGAIADLRARADQLDVPVVYVNDNYGEWHSERSRLIDHVRAKDPTAREIADMLAPRPDDYFVIKPRFSGFYSTNLPVLLPQLSASRLVLTGMAADICVLFTAADAHMREYDIWAPADAVASFSAERTRWALEIMAEAMKAETKPGAELALEDWLERVDA